MNTITTLTFSHKELAEKYEITTKEFINTCIDNHLLVRDKGKTYFICDESFYVIVQNEMNNIPFKQYFWSECGVKMLDRIFSYT